LLILGIAIKYGSSEF